MIKSILSKDLIQLIFYILFISFGIVLFIKMLRQNNKAKKNKYLIALVITYFICFSIPIEKCIDYIPIKHSTIEEAYMFDNGFIKSNILYKKKYKNMYFIVGNVNISGNTILKFSGYKRTKNGYRTIRQPSDNYHGIKIVDNNYIINYIEDKSQNITGIFISRERNKNLLDANTKISDKYGTKFAYIKDSKENPIKYGISDNYVFFGIIDHKIESNYYIIVNDNKIKIK